MVLHTWKNCWTKLLACEDPPPPRWRTVSKRETKVFRTLVRLCVEMSAMSDWVAVINSGNVCVFFWNNPTFKYAPENITARFQLRLGRWQWKSLLKQRKTQSDKNVCSKISRRKRALSPSCWNHWNVTSHEERTNSSHRRQVKVTGKWTTDELLPEHCSCR
jgi:hypothetical protein